MSNVIERKLFAKHYVVGTEKENADNQFQTLCTLVDKFSVRIVDGIEYADKCVIRTFSENLGIRIPEPFYRGFPQTVRELTSDELLFDQVVHYIRTYGFGDFSENQHSVLENFVGRSAFKEDTTIREFTIIPPSEVDIIVDNICDDLCMSTRPLSLEDYELVVDRIKAGYIPKEIASKNLAVKLCILFRDYGFLGGCMLSDVIKLVDELNYEKYNNKNLKKLRFSNADKRFISDVINYFFDNDKVDTVVCCEKKKIWCGLLHHIHYVCNSTEKRDFCNIMRGNKNYSIYSKFENAISNGSPVYAAGALKNAKGNGALVRNLNYIISRCNNKNDIANVVSMLDATNGIVLMQMLFQYANYVKSGNRTFSFVRHNMQISHTETAEECNKRKSLLNEDTVEMLNSAINELVIKHFENTLGKVYVDPKMLKIALPIQESATNGGFGVLPKGSRVAIPNGKKIRAFTYWEKVNDIDLSCFGLTDDGERIEFSWRTMYNKQSNAITFSGDETSGYNGGSEYFDIDIDKFRAEYPDVTKIIFCDNVYSSGTFADYFCKAGFMLRDIEDSGEVYEPKTVATSYIVNADSSYAYLFGIDLELMEMVWLNMSVDSCARIAGNTAFDFIARYFKNTEVMSIYNFAGICATEIVDSPEKADICFTDAQVNCKNVVHSYDIDKMLTLINV